MEIKDHTHEEECKKTGLHGCCCHHSEAGEGEEHGETSLRGRLRDILITIALLIGACVITHTHELSVWQQLLAFLPAFLLIGHDTLVEAWEGIREGDFYNENFLMSVATIGALLIGFLPGAETEFPEAVFVMLFFQIGELFEDYAEGKSRQSISHLMDIRPDTATVERNGKETTLSPEEVRLNDTVVVRPGERVPVDGLIIEGSTTLDTMALTGESIPRSAHSGDEVLSGCINLTGLIRLQATKVYGESTVAKILSLVESATEQKSESESFITKFARIYTPIVVWAAILLAFVPPLFGELSYEEGLGMWLHRALIFLIVSCPCALVISVPLTFFAGIGGASRHGILVKGSNYMDVLSKLDTVVFDKTGTLTRGTFSVQEVVPTENTTTEQLLRLAALAEQFSTHPIAKALQAAYTPSATEQQTVSNVKEIAGRGIEASIDQETVYVGNAQLMADHQINITQTLQGGTTVHIATDRGYAGYIVIADDIKSDSKNAIAALKHLGIRHTVMLTGDSERVAHNVATAIGIDSYHAELLPTDKVARVEQLLQARNGSHTLAFVGDGINDAPVLKRADVGIAMGALGSDAAIEAADVVLMDDKPSKIAIAIRIARKTIRIARQNIGLAIGIKIAVLALATIGLGNMGLAVFADVGVTVLAVFNAMRALKK